jgi:hypothetical protein
MPIERLSFLGTPFTMHCMFFVGEYSSGPFLIVSNIDQHHTKSDGYLQFEMHENWILIISNLQYSLIMSDILLNCIGDVKFSNDTF